MRNGRTIIPGIRQNFIDWLNEVQPNSHQVERDVGIGYSSVAKWRSGKHWPEPENLERLAEHYGFEVIELFMTRDERVLWRMLRTMQDSARALL